MNIRKITFRSFILGVCLLACSFSTVANDTIRFTWQVNANQKNFTIKVPVGEQFRVSWGDGADSTFIGAGSSNFTARHTYVVTGSRIVTIVAADNYFTYFACSYGQVSDLDVKKSPKLAELFCNNNDLVSLDVSKNMELERLFCSFNRLSSLDMSENAGIDYLDCSFNQLTSLNVNKNKTLRLLNCSSNRLDSLNIDKTNTMLNELNCSFNKLSSLDIRQQTKLGELLCSSNQLTSLDISRNSLLYRLECSSNKISRLDISNNTALIIVSCDSNRLPLSDLYAISQKIINANNKILGYQTLLPQTVCIGKNIFSEQSVFNGINTNYVVTKNGTPAPASDYIVSNGMIKFNELGDYTLTMTNTAIISHTNYPAIVIATITVREAGMDATLSNLIVSEGVLAPNFQSNTLNYTVNVGKDVEKITITAILSDSNAIISGDTGTQTLQMGENIFTITVTAEDEVTEKEYIVKITRADVSINNYELPITNYAVYPNPTTGQLTINNGSSTGSLPGTLSKPVLSIAEVVEVYDVVGKLQKAECKMQNGKIEIDISHLAKGMYFLKIDGKTVKVVKN